VLSTINFVKVGMGMRPQTVLELWQENMGENVEAVHSGGGTLVQKCPS